MGDEDYEEVETSLNDLATGLRPLLSRWFSTRAPAAEVDDLVQEVFLRIIRRGGVRELNHFQAYAFNTASSVLKDRMRRRRARAADNHIEFDPDTHAQAVSGPDDHLLTLEALQSTTRILLEMPERTRTIFVLRRLEGMAIGEICRRLGLSKSAVEKHMQRATRHLMSRSEDL